MGKYTSYSTIRFLTALILMTPATSYAEDIFLDCSNANVNKEQCAALYNEQAFFPTDNNYQLIAKGDPNYPVVQPGNINPNYPDYPIDATIGQNFVVPGMGYEVPQRQVVMRDTAAPLAVSQPADELEELGSEYAMYKTPTGSLIVEHDSSREDLADGSSVQITRRKETTVTPPYVEMPSISAHQRTGKLAYGEDVHDWEANNGDSLRALLIEWGQKSGWTVVWKLDRDYILEAGVVFRGNFTEVASAIIRTFARAIPAPIGTFYKGNRVLVINTQEDDNA